MKEATEVKGTVSGLNGKGGAVKANKPKRRECNEFNESIHFIPLREDGMKLDD